VTELALAIVSPAGEKVRESGEALTERKKKPDGYKWKKVKKIGRP